MPRVLLSPVEAELLTIAENEHTAEVRVANEKLHARRMLVAQAHGVPEGAPVAIGRLPDGAPALAWPDPEPEPESEVPTAESPAAAPGTQEIALVRTGEQKVTRRRKRSRA